MYRLSKERNDEDLRARYAHKACEQIFGFIYFTCSAYWGWSVLKDTPYLPWYLGGMAGGDYTNTSMKTIFGFVDLSIYDYSLYTYGYHAGDFFQHVFMDEHMNDFEEMFLHHTAAVCLYFAYIFGNMLYLGSVVAYLHDLADIFGRLCKGLNATIYQDSSAIFFVMCMIVWFATRIYSLPQMIYFILTKCIYPPELEQFQPYIYLSGIFLSVMCALHYYWFAMFIKILSRYVKTGEAKDDQNNLE